MPKVATEPPVAETGANVGMAGDEPPLQSLVEDHRAGFAQRLECWIWIVEEGAIGWVEHLGRYGAERFNTRPAIAPVNAPESIATVPFTST
jgi:hypothetical protein